MTMATPARLPARTSRSPACPKPAVAPSQYVDPLIMRAVARDARERGVRQRVCVACVTFTDKFLGGIHSALGCQRCGDAPCVGAVVELRK